MASMTPEQHHLVKHIRVLVDDEPDVCEVSMFGNRAVMVNGKMIVSAGEDGDLLVHVAANQHETLLREPGTEQTQTGAGQATGPGWVTVIPEAIADDDGLAFWVDVAMHRDRVVTGGQSGSNES